ncbi:MAG: esterase [Crocinitomix sp.]|jgi:esterase
MKLFYRILGNENEEGNLNKKPLFILHGLFGSSDNWQTLAKKFAEDYVVYLVDQRNHGHSPHADAFNYDLMADDFHSLITELGLSKINVIGHSMGGKTVINFAKNHPDLLDKMIIVDISHKQYPMHHEQILAGLNAIDLSTVKTRGSADKILREYVSELGVRQFLLKNLYWIEKGQLAWRINIPVLSRSIHETIGPIEFDVISVNTLFVRGGRSNYILETDYAEIATKFTNSNIYSITKSGHWIHAEAPLEFYTTVIDFLQ